MEKVELRDLNALAAGRVAILITIDNVGTIDYYANTERLTIHSALAMIAIANFRLSLSAVEGAAQMAQAQAEEARKTALILPDHKGDGIIERLS